MTFSRLLASYCSLLALPVPAIGQADNVIPLNNSGSVSIGIQSGFNAQPLLDAMATFDAQGAQELGDAISNGEVAVGVLDNDVPGTVYGVHDANTIGLPPKNCSGGLGAVALAHEWKHAKAAQAAGTSHDPLHSDPCGPIAHAQMTSDSASLACELASSSSGTEKEKLCRAYSDFSNAGHQQLSEALQDPACSTDPPPHTDLFPGCPACN